MRHRTLRTARTVKVATGSDQQNYYVVVRVADLRACLRDKVVSQMVMCVGLVFDGN